MPWGHMGKWRYRSISELDGGQWSVSRPSKSPRYPLGRSVGPWRREKSLVPVRYRTPTVHPAACRYIDWAIPAPFLRPVCPTGNKVNPDVSVSTLLQSARIPIAAFMSPELQQSARQSAAPHFLPSPLIRKHHVSHPYKMCGEICYVHC
jgi:hypothetical protein